MPTGPNTGDRRHIESVRVDGPSLFERQAPRAHEPVIEGLPAVDVVSDEVDPAIAADTWLEVVAHLVQLTTNSGEMPTHSE